MKRILITEIQANRGGHFGGGHCLHFACQGAACIPAPRQLRHWCGGREDHGCKNQAQTNKHVK